MIGEDYPDFPGTSYFEDDWAYLNSILNDGYDALEKRYDLLYGASLWILDVLNSHDLLQEAEGDVLPVLSAEAADQLDHVFPAVDYTYLLPLVIKTWCTLRYRNRDCKVYTAKSESARYMNDEATVRSKHHQDVPSADRTGGNTA